jgi:hypothetical protein
MFTPTSTYDDPQVLDGINKPAWAFDATVHPVMVHALRVHAQRSSLRSDGHFNARDKQEISELFQQPQPTMSDDIAVALGVDKSILEHLPYSVAFGYLVRSIVIMILKAEGSALDAQVSSFLREILDLFHPDNGNLLTTVHPLKIGVLDEVQTGTSRGRNDECLTLELLYKNQLCALLIPVQTNGRQRIAIEFNPNYKSNTNSSVFYAPEMTTNDTFEEANPMIYMHQDTFLGNDYGPSHSMHYNHELYRNDPRSNNYSTQPDTPQRSYDSIPSMSSPPPTQSQNSMMSQRETHTLNEPDFLMQGFDAFNVNSVFENSRGRTFPVSRMYVTTDSGTVSTPWRVRSNGNRLLSSAAARLAGTSAQIGSKPRWAQ